MPTTKSQDAYRRWYERNKAQFNPARAAKYASDPSLRQKRGEHQREYRRNNPPARSDGTLTRQVNGTTIRVFRIGQVAQLIGRDVQVIRIWERAGRIPKPTIAGAQRLYTQRQVNLLIDFAQLMTTVRYDHKVRAKAIEQKAQQIALAWSQGEI